MNCSSIIEGNVEKNETGRRLLFIFLVFHYLIVFVFSAKRELGWREGWWFEEKG